MTLARKQITITDEAGNIVPNAFIEVRRESAGAPLAFLFSDRAGAESISNPFQADNEGFAAFHVIGGAYKVRAYAPGFQRIWRYVGIGTAAEFDFSAGFNPRGAWDGETTYAAGDSVSYNDGESDNYAFALIEGGDGSNAPTIDGGGVGQSDANWQVLGLVPNNGNVSSTTILNIEQISQAGYDALDPPDDATLYVIEEEGE